MKFNIRLLVRMASNNNSNSNSLSNSNSSCCFASALYSCIGADRSGTKLSLSNGAAVLLLPFFLSLSSLCFKPIYFDSIWHIKQIPGKSTTNLPQTMKLPNVKLAFENYFCTSIHAASIWLLLIFMFVLGWAGAAAAAAALLHLFQSSQLFYRFFFIVV